MSPSDKGRRGAGTSNGPTHVFRGGAPAVSGRDPSSSSSSPSSSSNPSNTTRNKEVIAPPPRVQLTSSSPSAEDQSIHPPNGTPAPRSRRGSNAPSTRSLATSVAEGGTGGGATTSSKEKDLRIAHLERELVVMETEFQRELDRLSQNESETASFWQAKHSALNQQFLRTDTELRLMRDEARARETEAEGIARGWRDALRAETAARDDEIRDLRAQVRGLKEWVSTSTRADGTASTSDEVFGEGMARLGNSLQNWVITNFRRAKLDLSRAGEATLQELAELVPTYEELAQAAKVHLLQSIVSSILVRRVFRAYFVGLSPEQEEDLRRAEELVASSGKCFRGLSYESGLLRAHKSSLGSVESVNHWRSVTLSILKKEAAEHMQVQTTQINEHVVINVNRILDAITTDTATAATSGGSSVTTEARDQSLRQLINNAIELSRLLVVQKAAFKVWMPEIVHHQRVMFDHATMEDIGGEDEESLIQRDICCVTFPGIIKRGDENGAQLQFRNVISKARVLCSPE